MQVIFYRIVTKNILRNTYRNQVQQRGLSTKLSYKHQTGEEPLTSLTIGQMFDKSVDKFWNREAIVSCHENNRLTFSEVREKVDTFAAGLLAAGLNRGDRLGIWAANQVQWYITFMAAAKLGLVLVTLNPMYQGPEMEHCLKKSEINALITDHKIKKQNNYDVLREIIPNLPKSEPGCLESVDFPDLKTIIVTSPEKLEGTFSVKDINSLSSIESKNKLQKIENEIDMDHPFNMQFTSGTTGKPKATVVTHHSMVNNGYFIGKRNGFDKKPHKLCVQVPLFHAFGTGCAILGSLPFGTTLVLPNSMYSPTKTLDALTNEKCSVIYGTPTMFVDLIQMQKHRGEKLFLETICVGGAPSSPQLFKEMKEVLRVEDVISVYGLTEVTAVAFQSLGGEDEDILLSTVGHVMDHLEVKVVDEENRVVPVGTAGELCIRSYSTMMGYWKDEDKTKEIMGEDDWFKTGDKFILHENGYGEVVGRIKDIIIRGGENIFPKEIEDFLITHPSIKECQVIGVSDRRLGEEICACVRLNEGTNLNIDDIKDFCKHKLAYFKIPKYLKVFEEFPKTTSGKIQKFKLKEIVQKDLHERSFF